METTQQNLQTLRLYYDEETAALARKLAAQLDKADRQGNYDDYRKIEERIEYEIAIRS